MQVCHIGKENHTHKHKHTHIICRSNSLLICVESREIPKLTRNVKFVFNVCSCLFYEIAQETVKEEKEVEAEEEKNELLL